MQVSNYLNWSLYSRKSLNFYTYLTMNLLLLYTRKNMRLKILLLWHWSHPLFVFIMYFSLKERTEEFEIETSFFSIDLFEDFKLFVAYHGWCLCAYSDILQGKSSYNSNQAWSFAQYFPFLTSYLFFLNFLLVENKCLVSKSCLCWF